MLQRPAWRAPGSPLRAVRLVLCVSLAAGCASRAPEIATPAPHDAQTAVTAPARRSFVIPAIEIVAMDALINLAARPIMEDGQYAVSAASIRRNLGGPWVTDTDSFAINQFLHPYQGAMYHAIARSSGLNYWQSAAYTFAGSALWEIAGETTPPSKNDQIASGIAGSFLGEPLHRISHVILVKGGEHPGFLRALAATLVSPPTGVTRGHYAARFDAGAPGEMPFADLRLEIGMTALRRGGQSVTALQFTDAFIGFTVDAEFPDPDRDSRLKPFDAFRLEGIASSGGFQTLATRGLLIGSDYGSGVRGRGVWGVYAGYDYFAPGIFRVSSTNASFGSTAQSQFGSLTLQGTALVGFGYTAAQPVECVDDRIYHYGLAPQGSLATRISAGRHASLDAGVRGYLVGDLTGSGDDDDVILRADATLAVRIAGKHGLAVRTVRAERRATPPGLPALTQHESTLGIFYTFMGAK